MMTEHSEPSVGIGETISLAPLGMSTRGRVVSRTWSPALGQVLRVAELSPAQAGPMLLLYGEALDRLLHGRGPSPQGHTAA